MKIKNDKLSRKDWLLLMRIFEREIEGTLPYQSKSREYKRLENSGLVQFGTEKRHFNDGLPAMEISGWWLTELGRYLYCVNCTMHDM